jgi:MFS family permease
MTAAGGAARFYRPYLPLFGGIFLCLLGVGAALATLPFYVLRQLHGNKVEVGVVVAAISVAAVLARPVAGRLADRHGYKLIMLSGTVICMAAGAAYFGGRNVAALCAVRVLHGIGEGSVYTAGAAWLVALAPVRRRGRIVGLYGICMWLGITLGALLGTVAMRLAGFGAVWGLCVVAGAAGFATVAAKERPAGRAGRSSRSASAPSSRSARWCPARRCRSPHSATRRSPRSWHCTSRRAA